MNELHRDDILLQLNCLELLSDLAVTEHGLLYLDQEGIIGKLETLMHSTEDDPLASFLIPGESELYTKIIHHNLFITLLLGSIA